MSNILTSNQVKEQISPVKALDPAFYDKSIQFIEDDIISCILTKALYDDMVLKVAGLPGTPLTPAYQLLFDKILPAEANAIAVESYGKDLVRTTRNQGIMKNRTSHSDASEIAAENRALAVLKNREFKYCVELQNFLIDDAAKATPDYPLFVEDDTIYTPNLRRFAIL